MGSYLHPEVMYEYVEEVDPNLTCAICQSALVDPVTTASCKHTFCRDCITRAISINLQCPIDRSALSVHSLKDTEQLVKLMLDELKVKCGADECGQVMQRGLLLGHVRTCQKTIVKCHDGDCGLSMARFRLPHHRAYECFQRKMECSQCGVILTFRDQTSHDHAGAEVDTEECDRCGQHYGTSRTLHQWTCPQSRVPCPQQSRGCAALPARADLTTHLSTCPFEALASFFEINDARLAILQAKNQELIAQVERLQADLDSVRASGPRQTFGDRWRAAGLGGLQGVAGLRVLGGFPEPENVTEEQNTDLLPSQQESSPLAPAIQIQRSTPQRAPDLAPPPSSPEPATSAPTPAISPNQASRLRPASTVGSPLQQTIHQSPSDILTSRAATDMQVAANRNQFLPPMTSSTSFADHAFQQLSGERSTEETVVALRNVVVHLAAGMDQMERRQEVRTITENLRVLDEVGSLRAIVNTMRMQVMMDRSSSLQPPPRHVPPDLPDAPNDEHGPSSFSTLPAARGLHRSMILAHRSMHARASEDGPRPSLDGVEGWRQGVRESVAFSAMGTNASVYGDRAESVTSSRVTVGRPMGIPPASSEGEQRTIGRGSSRALLHNPLSLLSRRSRRPSVPIRPT